VGEINSILLSLQFLTRIPIPFKLDVKKDNFFKIASYFPFVGFVIGIIQFGFYIILKNYFSREILMMIIVAISYILTGAMHIDGLADTFDGLFSNKNKENMLEIMRDSRLGTNGVLAVVFIILLKTMALAEISTNMINAAILLTAVIGRLCIVFSILISKSARKGEGLGGLMLGMVGIREFLIASIISIFIAYFIISLITFIKILTLTFLIAFLSTKYISYKIGGMTGDTLGAINELSELSVLLCFLLIK